MTLQETTDKLNEEYKHLKQGREYILDNKHIVKIMKKGVAVSYVSSFDNSLDGFYVTNSRLKDIKYD